jgi:hypothetical protein
MPSVLLFLCECAQKLPVQHLGPAQCATCATGDSDGALKVFDAICSETAELVDLTEFEYKFLLHVLSVNNRFEDLQRVWLHMKENLSTLTPLTISLVNKYFTQYAGVKADGSPAWKVSTVLVDPKVCTAQLVLRLCCYHIDIDTR